MIYLFIAEKIGKCRYNDVGCITFVVNNLFANYSNGIPDVHLGALEPLVIEDTIEAHKGGEGSITLSLVLKNCKAVGLSKGRVSSVR